MLPALYCPTSTAGLAIAGVQCLNLLAGLNEVASPTPYSKFSASSSPLAAVGSDVPSKTGMLIIYAPPAATAAAALAFAPTVNGREVIVASLLLVHFAKRVLETLFVHKYSGSMKAATATFIGVFYSLVSLLITTMQLAVPPALYAGAGGELGAALALFCIGQAGNLWHHWLLADMRKPERKLEASADGTVSQYTIPSGGLFDLVTMPHYLFEIIAWFGIALAAQQLNAVLVACGMTSYLSGRAIATTRWYKDKFGDKWPAQRKNLVPFVF
jgi:hypothetical protein